MKTDRTDARHHFTTIHLDLSGEYEANTPEVLTMGPVVLSDAWKRLDEFIAAAKKRPKPDTSERPVIIDFGPLTYTANPTASNATEKPSLVDQVRAALGLSTEHDTWGEHVLFISPLKIHN